MCVFVLERQEQVVLKKRGYSRVSVIVSKVAVWL